jgi:hypothetical protein
MYGSERCSMPMGCCLGYNFKLTVSDVGVIMIFVGFFAASPLVLLGEKNMRINRYYSAKPWQNCLCTCTKSPPAQPFLANRTRSSRCIRTIRLTILSINIPQWSKIL